MSKSSGRKSVESSVGGRNSNPRRCIYCGVKAPLVWVHGHGQCANCGINVEECCRGESCQKIDRAI